MPQTLDDIPDIPVFPSVEARQEFERKEITVVDLSLTENMYKIHVIEQVSKSNPICIYILSNCSTEKILVLF